MSLHVGAELSRGLGMVGAERTTCFRVIYSTNGNNSKKNKCDNGSKNNYVYSCLPSI